MMASGFTKHLRKNPPPDEEIAESVGFLKAMCDKVLGIEPSELDHQPVTVSAGIEGETA